jgi:CRP-like cAMP-binding protein/uncharacterized protein (DUF2225 family)
MFDISSVKNYGKVMTIPKGSVLFMQNDVGEDMYIVLKGRVSVLITSLTGFPVKVAEISEGGFFGEQSVIDGWPRSATIITNEDCSLFQVQKKHFLMLIKLNKEIALSILTSLSERVTLTTGRVQKLGQTVDPLPPELASPTFDTPQENLDRMVLLSKRLRELNETIGGLEKKPEPKKNFITKILPDEHPLFEAVESEQSKEYLITRLLGCPHCGHKFEGEIPAVSRLSVSETTVDQRMIYGDFDILWYANSVCPNCNYSNAYQEFTRFKRLNTKTEEHKGEFANDEQFTGFSPLRTMNEVVLSYYLSIECMMRTPISYMALAKAWHKLYWIYSDYHLFDLQKKAATGALVAYAAYIDANKELALPSDRMQIYVICGELCSFLGDNTQAKLFYTKAIKSSRPSLLNTADKNIYQHAMNRVDKLNNIY